MSDNYYAQKLNASNLYQVYQTRHERVRQYLDAEIDFIRQPLKGNEKILELGAGYGRIIKELAPHAALVVGVDISADSVALGKEYLKDCPHCRIEVMDAHRVEFDFKFDVVLCLQNALSALKGDPLALVKGCLDLLVEGGTAYFSTYSARFWDDCMLWFQEQADKGLLGEIDLEKTGNGRIVCKDGFTATTFTPGDLERLGKESGYPYSIEEVDASSLFLIVEKK